MPPGDADALSAAIVEVLERPDLAARWGEAGRRRVAREFSAERMAQEVRALYEALLSPARADMSRMSATQTHA